MTCLDTNILTIIPVLKSCPLPNITSPRLSKHFLLQSCGYSLIHQIYYSIQLTLCPPLRTTPLKPQYVSPRSKQTSLISTLTLCNKNEHHTMEWSISQKKLNKLQHALNGNPNTEIQTPHTVQQIQELVNAMTIDIMHKLPPYSPTILQYSANTTISNFVQKNGIKPSRKTGYITVFSTLLLADVFSLGLE